jgi:molecular chaperone Hsp33
LKQDKIVKALAYDQSIRIYGMQATNTVAEIQQRTEASPEVSVALGRLAMGSLFIGALESSEAKIYTKMNGGGPVGNIHADSDAQGHVRAYATNAKVHVREQVIDDEASNQLVGNDGFLYIMKDLGLKEWFTSQTRLVTGDVVTELNTYFNESQQTPTILVLDVLLDGADLVIAGGFAAQVLPGVQAEALTAVMENVNTIASVPAFLAEHTIEELLALLTNDSAEILEELPVSFHCTCSKDRFLDAFATLPPHELVDMLADAHDEEVICQYCGEKYYITNEELVEIIDKKEK